MKCPQEIGEPREEPDPDGFSGMKKMDASPCSLPGEALKTFRLPGKGIYTNILQRIPRG